VPNPKRTSLLVLLFLLFNHWMIKSSKEEGNAAPSNVFFKSPSLLCLLKAKRAFFYGLVGDQDGAADAKF
jgi:hypothetical protein